MRIPIVFRYRGEKRDISPSVGETLFCTTDGQPITPREAHSYFPRVLQLSKQLALRVARTPAHVHVRLGQPGDQRVIDDPVGHSADEQRRY